ncbi:MAG TPA: response regulator transcription factor [Candidatus Dormibacteraeota bacterium]|jgi:DNA-binding response OmpR family regulator|nr:response regulator transcription factor [Candidatus Dormibacteraeota bacterium]
MPRLAPARALIIEANGEYRAVIATCADLAGVEVESVATVSAGVRRLADAEFDLVIWGVPPGDPRREPVIAQIHEECTAPLVLLDEAHEQSRASYEAGADQILPKPFVPGQLVGAIKSALRGPGPTSLVPLATRIELAGGVIDSGSRSITHGDTVVTFSKRDWELLTFLLGNPGQWFTAEQLVRLAWRSSRFSAEQLRSYVLRVRRKLAPLDLPFAISSQQGRGYRFDLNGSDPG